jgi:hypothetical protein
MHRKVEPDPLEILFYLKKELRPALLKYEELGPELDGRLY